VLTLLAASLLAVPAQGTFTNPVLFGDYPDPDVIRVGDDFYLATTTFVSVPGLEVLHSHDLVHWEIAGYAVSRFETDPKYNLTGGNRYAAGVWAPSIRYHNGTFYILDNIQGSGTVVFRATKPSGPWKSNKLDGYLYDPGLMFDDDGTPLVYFGAGGDIRVAELDPELTRVVSSVPAYKLPAGEGSHAYKVNGLYYVFNSLFAHYPTLICSRSKSRTGPFQTVTVCDSHIPWSSPHQGGIVQLQNGAWWGFSLVDSGAVGRTVWIGPVTWSQGWPYFGDPASPSMPKNCPLPPIESPAPIRPIPAEDHFDRADLSLPWEWNHNPDDAKWSLKAAPGHLRLFTQTAPNLPSARNTLTRRTEGPVCTGTVKLEIGGLRAGDRAGLALFEQYFGYLAIYKDPSGLRIVRAVNKNGSLSSPSEDVTDNISDVRGKAIWLRASCDFHTDTGQFSYSLDGERFTPVGERLPLHFTLATFQGVRFGIFCYNPEGSNGWLDVGSFAIDVSGSSLNDRPDGGRKTAILQSSGSTCFCGSADQP
jgi:beta-xylosidase